MEHFSQMYQALLLTLVCYICFVQGSTEEILMPGISPKKDDHYMCTSKYMGPGVKYITSIEAQAKMEEAHHILLFGCKTRPKYPNRSTWDCISMAKICDRDDDVKIIYAWARNAPPTVLPDDVGFKVGEGTDIPYIVMQIHYMHQFKDGHKDHSGLQLGVTTTVPRYLAGVGILAADSDKKIPPHRNKYHIDVSCKLAGSSPIHPFAFRVHSHTLGKVISGYKVHQGHWTQLGKGNPQWPQAFYPMDKVETVMPGDTLAARCTYDSTALSTVTRIGSTGSDEMCNFYVMYYTDSDGDRLTYFNCFYEDEKLFNSIPADSDIPLPPNPVLDAQVHHHHHEDEESDEKGTQMQAHEEEPAINQIDEEFIQSLLANSRGPSRYGGLSRGYPNNDYEYEYIVDDGRPVYPAAAGGGGGGGGLPYYPYFDDSMKSYVGLGRDSAPYSTEQYNVLSGLTPDRRSDVPSLVVDDTWPRSAWKVGDISGLSTDKAGNLYIFHRAGRVWDDSSFSKTYIYKKKYEGPISQDTVMIVDQETGKVIRSWGAGRFYLPHGIHVDHEGNVWVTDVAMQQVFKFQPDGSEILLSLGTAFEPGNDESHFCKPADIAVSSHGHIYVADGYCNQRIVVFKENGGYVKTWELGNYENRAFVKQGYPPVIHSITLAEDKGWVCTVLRYLQQIICIDVNDPTKYVTYRDEKLFGPALFAIEYTPSYGGLLYGVTAHDGPTKDHTSCRGVTVDIMTGQVINTWKPPQLFTAPHDIAVNKEGNAVFVGQLHDANLWKFVPENIHEKKDSLPVPLLQENVDGADVINQAAGGVDGISDLLPEINKRGPIISGQSAEQEVEAYDDELADSRRLVDVKTLMDGYSNRKDKFNLGNFMSRHSGFDRVRTDESDHEIDPLNGDSDSDIEEYTGISKA